MGNPDSAQHEDRILQQLAKGSFQAARSFRVVRGAGVQYGPVGSFPYDENDPEARRNPPISEVHPLTGPDGEILRGVKTKRSGVTAQARDTVAQEGLDTARIGGRLLTMDSQTVGTTAIIVVQGAHYPRKVSLRAAVKTITISTQAGVTANSGWTLAPGERIDEIIVPANQQLYAIASAAGGRLHRMVIG